MTRVAFFQGVMASKFQLLRYTGLFTPSEAPVPDSDLPEVHHGWTFNVFFLISMLVSKFIFWMRNQSYTPAHAIRFWRLNIGGERDCGDHKKRLDAALSSKEPVICFGVSRGAMTTFISLALRTDSSATQVKLALLEGCPDSIPNVLSQRHGPSVARIFEFFLEKLTFYSRKRARSHSALSLVNNFPRNIPVAFITSDRDTAVPRENTLRLAEALRDSGHPNVHVLVLKHATHDNYFDGHADDRKAYFEFVQQLRQRYGC